MLVADRKGMQVVGPKGRNGLNQGELSAVPFIDVGVEVIRLAIKIIGNRQEMFPVDLKGSGLKRANGGQGLCFLQRGHGKHFNGFGQSDRIAREFDQHVFDTRSEIGCQAKGDIIGGDLLNGHHLAIDDDFNATEVKARDADADQLAGIDGYALIVAGDPDAHIAGGIGGLRRVPQLKSEELVNGLVYYDCLMHSPERLSLDFLMAAAESGADLANYAEVTDFVRTENTVTGVEVTDLLSGHSHTISGHVVVNASGPWADLLLGLMEQEPARHLMRSKGVHIARLSTMFSLI
jgi:hypothetical protein